MDFGSGPHNGAVALPIPRQSSSDGGPIVAVVTDGLGAIAVARRVLSAARATARPVVLLVPMRRPAFTTDAAVARLAYERSSGEAEAVASRVRSLLEAAEVAVVVRVVWYRTWLARAPGRAGSRSVAAAARKVGAAFLITPGGLVDVNGTCEVEASGHARRAFAESRRAADFPGGAA